MSTHRPSTSHRRLVAIVAAALLLVGVVACQPAETTTGQTGAAPSIGGVWA